MDLYKYAAQNGLRFSSNKGGLTVEQLFDLPLTSKSGFDLNSVAKSLNTSLKSMAEESFVDDNPDPGRKRVEYSLEIVKDVIKTKQEENAAALNKLKNKQERERLQEILNTKKDQQLLNLSTEEIEKRLAALS